MTAGTAGRTRVAMVGLGGIAQTVHLPLLERRRDVFELTAVVDLSQERTDATARRLGVPDAGRFRSVADLLAARASGAVAVDGVVLATTGSHVPEVAELLAAGVPVLAEKPLGLSVTEIDALADGLVAQRRDPAGLLMVGYMKEHDPATARAREALTGTTLRAVDVEVLHPADAAQLHFAHLPAQPADIAPATLEALTGRTARAVDDAVGAGTAPDLRALYTNVLLGSVVHDIALLRHLVGGIETVDRVRRHGPGAPGSLQVTGTVAGGVALHLGWHFIADYPGYRETVTFHHETGTVELVFAVPYLLNVATELTVVSRAVDGDPAGGEVRATFTCAQQEAFERELLAFRELVVHGTPAPSGLAEGRADVVTAQLMLREVARGEGAVLGGEAASRG
ncbi:Gfo/Idh/MocA family protein [Actinotalea subterranea]|uniref:Gfo/Idh/MocA family protein n=1 Tax=Actinotalea subterranea TaxID=2607497 RepID=UPI0011EEC97D|nr:Gfo/Idh/MocA family oxidoreductase [Actinotalea subterranea]